MDRRMIPLLLPMMEDNVGDRGGVSLEKNVDHVATAIPAMHLRAEVVEDFK